MNGNRRFLSDKEKLEYLGRQTKSFFKPLWPGIIFLIIVYLIYLTLYG